MSVFPVFFSLGGVIEKKTRKLTASARTIHIFLDYFSLKCLFEKSKEVIVNRGERCLNEIDGVNFKEGIG